MARRRRLSPPSAEALAAASALQAPAPGKGGPVAPVAAEARAAAEAQASEIARLRSAARVLSDAEADGRLLLDIPLGEIAEDYIARDRLPREEGDEELAALRASIAAHGQRVPIEVVALTGGPKPYGLISGFRRLRALVSLEAETGEPRFAAIRALLTPPRALGEAFLAMVEENEIRAGLSFYERGRICALAAERGAFPSAEAALDALFAAVPRARRSKIRSFLRIHRELGPVLRWPEMLSERLGLRLAAALKAGQGAGIAARLAGASPAGPEAEQAAILAALGEGVPSRAEPETRLLTPGVRLECRLGAGGVELRLLGTGLDEAAVGRAIAALEVVFPPGRTGGAGS